MSNTMVIKQILKKSAPWAWLWLSLAVVLVDQIVKLLVVQHLSYAEPYAWLPFFNLTLSYNRGAAFSLLSWGGGWQITLFSVIALLVVIVMLYWLSQLPRYATWRAAGICLIIGGAVGNLIDRVRLHYVVDFFDFHIHSWHFATFNIADAAVTIGAAILIIALLFQKENDAR